MFQDVYTEVIFPAITQASWPLASSHAILFENHVFLNLEPHQGWCGELALASSKSCSQQLSYPPLSGMGQKLG